MAPFPYSLSFLFFLWGSFSVSLLIALRIAILLRLASSTSESPVSPRSVRALLIHVLLCPLRYPIILSSTVCTLFVRIAPKDSDHRPIRLLYDSSFRPTSIGRKPPLSPRQSSGIPPHISHLEILVSPSHAHLLLSGDSVWLLPIVFFAAYPVIWQCRQKHIPFGHGFFPRPVCVILYPERHPLIFL